MAHYVETNLPKEADGEVWQDKNRLEKGWWGWRWLLNAPDYLVSEAHKQAPRVRVDLWKASPLLGRALRGKGAQLAVSLLKPWRVLKYAAVLLMVLTSLLALHPWLSWPVFHEEKVRQSVEHPTRNGLAWLVRQYRETEPESFQRDSLYPVILHTARGLETDESIELPRTMLQENPASPDRLVELIAEINQSLGQRPLFLSDPERPIFSAAIGGNPVVLYREGSLQPGDWANIDFRTGYVSRIERNNLVFMVEEETNVIRYRPLKFWGSKISNLGTISFWQGQWNMRPILKTPCYINGWDLFDFGGYPGHIGGALESVSYENLISEIEEHLRIKFEGDKIIVHGENEVRSFLTCPILMIVLDEPIEHVLRRYSKQMGVNLEFRGLDKAFLQKRISFQDLQLGEVLQELGLVAELDREYSTITIQRP